MLHMYIVKQQRDDSAQLDGGSPVDRDDFDLRADFLLVLFNISTTDGVRLNL